MERRDEGLTAALLDDEASVKKELPDATPAWVVPKLKWHHWLIVIR